NQVNLMRWNVVLRSQVLDHRVRTALAQAVVVVFTANRVGCAFHSDDVALGVLNVSRELIQGFLGLLGQIVFIEPEVDRSFSNRPIVIQVQNCSGKAVHALHGGIGGRLGRVG